MASIASSEKEGMVLQGEFVDGCVAGVCDDEADGDRSDPEAGLPSLKGEGAEVEEPSDEEEPCAAPERPYREGDEGEGCPGEVGEEDDEAE